VQGTLGLPGSASDYDDSKLQAVANGIGNSCGLSGDNVQLTISARKTVTVVFVIYIPDGSTVTLTSITNSLNDLGALLTAINAALSSAGFPPIGSITVDIMASVSLTPSSSPSPSVSFVAKAAESKDNTLSDGAIAGIVIGSVFGAALIVAVIVFVQMKTTQRAHARTSSQMTAQAVEAEPAREARIL